MRPPTQRAASALMALALLAGSGAGLSACGSGGEVTDGVPAQGCGEVALDGGGGIEPPPDGPSLCPQTGCNYQTQTGCAPDEACRPSASGSAMAPACSVAGETPAGAACTMWQGECERGHFCLDAVCRRLCCGADWTACGSGESCIRQLFAEIDGAQTYLDVDLCFPVGTCDVLEPGSCAGEPGRECHIVDPTGAVACAPLGNRDLGEPCDEGNQCREGFHCVDDACRRLCRAEACGEPACPPAEGTCVHFDRDPVGVGECTPGW